MFLPLGFVGCFFHGFTSRSVSGKNRIFILHSSYLTVQIKADLGNIPVPEHYIFQGPSSCKIICQRLYAINMWLKPVINFPTYDMLYIHTHIVCIRKYILCLKIGPILAWPFNYWPCPSSSLSDVFFPLLKSCCIYTHTNLEWWASGLPSSGPHPWLGDHLLSHPLLVTSLLQLDLVNQKCVFLVTDLLVMSASQSKVSHYLHVGKNCEQKLLIPDELLKYKKIVLLGL